MKQREIQINGIAQLPEGMTSEQFDNLFFQFLDANGVSFGGGVNDVTEEND